MKSAKRYYVKSDLKAQSFEAAKRRRTLFCRCGADPKGPRTTRGRPLWILYPACSIRSNWLFNQSKLKYEVMHL